jgi:biopolymer transport protein ExbB
VTEGLALQVWDLWREGGAVMPALFTTAFVLWFALGERVLLLQRGDRRALRTLVEVHRAAPGLAARGVVGLAAQRGAALLRERGGPVPLHFLDEAFFDLEERLGSGTTLVSCLIAMSPLLGLLGTVGGLIETFGSLGQSSTSTASEGIAGGIVEALYATQMGLAIAVPGLLMGGFLHHREQKLRVELEELKALLSGALRPRTP